MMIRIALFLLAFATPLRADITIQDVTSPGGITAWLVQEDAIPFIALEIRFNGGTSLDAPGKRGAVNLMTALIEEGAGDLDSQGFAKARDDLAAQFRFRSDQDGVSVSAQFLTENSDAAMTLLQQALTQPRFDQDALDRVRGQVEANLRASEKDPSTIAQNIARARSYGVHPYATSGDGTLQSVAALTRDDMIAAHAGALARDRVTVSAAGNITPEQLGPLLDKLLGGLPAAGAPLPDRADLVIKGGVKTAAFPGPQSVVLFGHGGMRFDDPDFITASIINEILGGGRFTARLMTEVREKRGLTYGIGTSLSTSDHSEALMGQFSASNENVAEAMQVIRDEWSKIAAQGVTEADLNSAKTYMTGAYPLRFDGNGTIASLLVGMQIMGLPTTYPATRNARVDAVTMADVQRVAARLLKPDDLFFVVVGEPVGVTATE
jgi:zinc protease